VFVLTDKDLFFETQGDFLRDFRPHKNRTLNHKRSFFANVNIFSGYVLVYAFCARIGDQRFSWDQTLRGIYSTKKVQRDCG
jgi:hypothetical protein